ncbi:MAG TPA: hypothetical protein VFE47_04345 [Tepidisphaeraceae bacterium]|jgi:hypothetical protein|nr:hypothetical protein [Tepidisphaeraceae bacterium]
MPNPTPTFYLKALSPVDAFQRFTFAISDAFGNNSVNELVVDTNLLPRHFVIPGGPGNTIPNDVGSQKTIEELKALDAMVEIRKIQTVCPTSQNAQQAINVVYKQDGIDGTIELTCQDAEIIRSRMTGFAQAFRKQFNLARKGDLLKAEFGEFEKEKLRYYERSLSDLTAATNRLQQAGVVQMEEADRYFATRRTKLDDEYQTRLVDLEKLHHEKLAEVEKDRQALAKEKAELDLRRSTAARRSLLTDMRTEMAKEFSIKVRTEGLRKPIFWACLVTMGVGTAILVVGMIRLLVATAFDWRFITLIWSGLAIGVTTLVYYLRWNNHWFTQLADDEFFVRKLNIDVLRASWVAEMLIEWKEEKDKPFPTELLTSFTEGLFRERRPGVPDHHVAADVAKFAGDISKFKVSKDAIEISKKA